MYLLYCFLRLHTIVLVILYCFLYSSINTIQTETCKKEALKRHLPSTWPCDWNNGIIPFAFNFFIINSERLVNVANRGIEHLERRSCLKFQERDPVELAKDANITYLFFTFSDVLEFCCLPVSSYYRRRIVLITPLCTHPVHVAHTTLHALGLTHKKRQPFPADRAQKVLFINNCTTKENIL